MKTMDMSANEIRIIFSKEVSEMVTEAIKQGCVLAWKLDKELQKQNDLLNKGKASDYSVAKAYRESLQATSKILERFFGGGGVVIQTALIKTAKIVNETPNMDYYLDEFINVLYKES